MGFGMASPFLLISQWPAARRLLPKPGAWMHRFRQILALPMLATAAWLFYVLVQLLYPTPMREDAGYRLIKPVAYSETSLAELRAQGVPVFVDATAAWCLTCKVNERVALKPERTQRFFADNGITLMIADWTARDASIAGYLATFGRNGVPLYVYYPPGKPPVILPQVLSPSVVIDTLSGNMTNP
jgi:thiol:disulfide interchange protein DsbD